MAYAEGEVVRRLRGMYRARQENQFTEGKLEITAHSTHAKAGELVEFTIEFVKHSAVPRSGELVLWFVCPPKQREGVLGDLEEDFQKCLRDHGLRTAQTWYWWQVLRTAAANASAFALKVTMAEAVLHKLGL